MNNYILLISTLPSPPLLTLLLIPLTLFIFLLSRALYQYFLQRCSKPILIGIVGNAGVGKDTAVDYLKSNHHFTSLAFADPLKQMGLVIGFPHRCLYGTQAEKLEKHPYWGLSGREFLQRFGDVCNNHIRAYIPSIKYNLWIDDLRRRYLSLSNKRVVVSDVRYPLEAKMLRELGGVLVRIERYPTEKEKEIKLLSVMGGDRAVANHSSELESSKIVCHYTIQNYSDLPAFYREIEKCVSIVRKLKKKEE